MKDAKNKRSVWQEVANLPEKQFECSALMLAFSQGSKITRLECVHGFIMEDLSKKSWARIFMELIFGKSRASEFHQPTKFKFFHNKVTDKIAIVYRLRENTDTEAIALINKRKKKRLEHLDDFYLCPCRDKSLRLNKW